MSDLPRVLFVDDEPDRLGGLIAQLELSETKSLALHPTELDAADLEGVHLVSVDQFLGDEWSEYLINDDRALSIATRASDGIAVAASLNSQLRRRDTPSALSLHTAEIDHLGEGLPAGQREALLAAQYDLDWVFRFDGPSAAALAFRMTSLSKAVASLPVTWSSRSQDFGSQWLAVPGSEVWSEYALAQVEDCRPPAHGLSENTHGRSVLRWLAHRILPYPTFLIDAVHLAVLLGATPTSTSEEVSRFSSAIYDGPLSHFSGDRWWRAGIQNLLAECGTSEAEVPEHRISQLNGTLGTQLVPLDLERPVVAYDANGMQSNMPIESSSAVRLQPDGWPVFADDPWATREHALSDQALRALVVHADREILDAP